MKRNLMAAIFLGSAIILFGVYALVNQSGNDQKEVEKNNTPSLDGSSATMALNDEGSSSSWESLSESPDDRNNATKNIARSAFEQMKALDQQGKSPFDEKNVNTAEVRDAMEKSVAETIDDLFNGVSVSNKDIRITANNTKEAKERYLKDMGNALIRHPAKKEYKDVEGGLQGLVERSCTTGDNAVSKDISGTYSEIAKDVATVQVPSQWADFHKKAITYFLQGKVLFNVIANCHEDPLKGFAAAQLLPTFGTESITLKERLGNLYTEIGKK